MADLKSEIRSKIIGFSTKLPLRLREMSANEALEFKNKMLAAMKTAQSSRSSELKLYEALSSIRLYFED